MALDEWKAKLIENLGGATEANQEYIDKIEQIYSVKLKEIYFLFKRTSFSIFKKLDSYFLNISWSKSQHKKLSEIQLGTCVQSKYLGKYLVKTRVTGQKITIHLYSPRMMVKKVKTWL